MRTYRWLGWAVLAGLVVAGGTAGASGDEPRGSRPPPRPPPEAIQACSGQQDGAACSFTVGERSVTGTCRSGPQGLPAACFPAGARRGPPPEAVQACNGQEEGAACAVTLDGNTLDGTCRSGPGGESLACLPDRPPPR